MSLSGHQHARPVSQSWVPISCGVQPLPSATRRLCRRCLEARLEARLKKSLFPLLGGSAATGARTSNVAVAAILIRMPEEEGVRGGELSGGSWNAGLLA